jgi:hypothetical protein
MNPSRTLGVSESEANFRFNDVEITRSSLQEHSQALNRLR